MHDDVVENPGGKTHEASGDSDVGLGWSAQSPHGREVVGPGDGHGRAQRERARQSRGSVGQIDVVSGQTTTEPTHHVGNAGLLLVDAHP